MKKGSHYTPDQKYRVGFQKGHPSYHTDESKRKIGVNGFHYGMLGKKQSEETIRKRMIKMNGYKNENNPSWKGGSMTYFKKNAKIRDNYTCQICGLRDIEIMEVDHIKPQCDYPELKLCLENLLTLCPNCHRRKTNRELRERSKR